MKNNVFFSWQTTKTEAGTYEFTVFNNCKLENPLPNGSYVITGVLNRGTRKTRAQAAAMAKKWVKYYNSITK